MNFRNIKSINYRQLSKAITREGRAVINAYTNEEYTVLFRNSGSQSISQEKVKIYYMQDTPIEKGMVLRYRNTHYMVMNVNDIESEVFTTSTLVRCNATWNIFGTDVYIISGSLSSPSPVSSGMVSGVSGNMSIQASDIPLLHTEIGLDSRFFAFGGIYKLINKFFVDGFAFIYFERDLYNAGQTYNIYYKGDTEFGLGTYRLNPYVIQESTDTIESPSMCVTDAKVVCSSSDETIATCNRNVVTFLKAGTVDITMRSVGFVENGGKQSTFRNPWEYDVSTTVTFTSRNETKYNVKVSSDEHGSATANKTVAHEGDTIVLSTTPISGYVFKEWVVISGGITVANNLFIMPDHDVELVAMFEEHTVPTYNVIVSTDGNGTAVASSTVAEAGTLITLGSNPNDGYQFKEWEVVSGGVTMMNDSFTMPENDVEIRAIFRKILPTLTVDISNWDNDIYGGFDGEFPTILLANGVPLTSQEEVDAIAYITYQAKDTTIVFDAGHDVDNVS